VYYDALLATVSEQRTRGMVSGFGVALGYIGAIAGILLVKPFVDAGGRGSAFLPTAVLFLLFALPCFLFVTERGPAAWRWRYLLEGYQQLLSTMGNARQHSQVFRFIIARFLYVDAISTVTTFMAVYTVKVLGFSDQENQLLFVLSTAFAVAGGFGYGFLADRLGPRRALTIILAQWAVVFVAAAVTFWKPAFWLIGPLAGISLGATWASDRALLARLAPPQQLGEFFGLYGLIGKLSAVLGPMIWGIGTLALAAWEPLNYRVTILLLLALLATGVWVLQGVRESQRLRD
ncbi:MAG: MFS transporter, partial [Chloroflexi bacterium]|nr:MFS transporter [Chloroflexota bacterium]